MYRIASWNALGHMGRGNGSDYRRNFANNPKCELTRPRANMGGRLCEEDGQSQQ
jgi:hypothetical protein